MRCLRSSLSSLFGCWLAWLGTELLTYAFDWDLRSGALAWDDRLLAMFGYTREEFDGTITAFDARVHPDDLSRVGEALQNHLTRYKLSVEQARAIHPDYFIDE